MNTSVFKRSIATIAVIAQLLVLLPLMHVQVIAEEASAESPVLNKTIVGTVSFQSFNFLGKNSPEGGGYQDGTDYSTTFYYTDDYFARSSINSTVTSKTSNWYDLEDVSMAACSMDLAVASYTSAEGDVIGRSTNTWNNTNYNDKDKNIKSFLSQCGFSYIEPHSMTERPKNDSIGYTLASKEITVWNEESSKNETYTLIAVGVRGAGYGSEWASNITIGDPATDAIPDNGRHYGFDHSADIVCGGIDTYLKSLSQKGKLHDKVKYWVSGYSRAGAVANLVAGKLTDDDGSTYHSQKKDIFGYTWECPQGAAVLANNANFKNYKNIHNIINAMDAVPKVSPSEFNHERLGVDYVMPYHGSKIDGRDITASENEEYYKAMYAMLEKIATGSRYGETDPLVGEDGYCNPRNYPYNDTITIYKMSATELILNDLRDGTLFQDFGTVEATRSSLDDYSKLLDKNGGWYIDDFIDNLVDVFLTSKAWIGEAGEGRTPMENRETFIQRYQSDFRTLFGYFLDFSGPAFLDMLDQLKAAILDEFSGIDLLTKAGPALAFYNFYNNPTKKYTLNVFSSDPFAINPLWSGKYTKDVLISESKSLAVSIANKMTEDFPDPEYQRIYRSQMNAALERLVELVINLYAYELDKYESQYLGTTLKYLNTILCTHEQETVLSWIMSLDPNHTNRGFRTLTVPINTDVKLYQFRDEYEEYDGVLSANGTGVLVAEYNNGTEVENLDQRISVSDDGDNMTIRYPALLDIRADVSTANQTTFIDDLVFSLNDYATDSAVQYVSAGKNQYESDPANYDRITEDTAKTDASVYNGYNQYEISLSPYDTLQIMANGSSSFDNSNPEDHNVYGINKLIYTNTIVEGQILGENLDSGEYRATILDQEGTEYSPQTLEQEVSYSAIRGADQSVFPISGIGSENEEAHKGNNITITVPTVKNDNAILQYFTTDARPENNQKLSSDSELYSDAEWIEMTSPKDTLVFDTGTDVQSVLEATDQVYHILYAGNLTYTVTWKNDDGSVLKTDKDVKYGTMPEYTGEEPQKQSEDDDYIYVFTGWDPNVVEVTGDQTYTAVFERREAGPVTFTLVHQDGIEETISVKNAAKGYDVTKKIGENTLYGGLFEDSAYDTAASTPGKKLIPEDGKTYYLREVPDSYLNLKTIYTKNSGVIKGSYSVANVDADLYDSVGFLYSAGADTEYEDVYDEVTIVTYPNGTRTESHATPVLLFKGSDSDKLAVDTSNHAGYTGTVQAFWVTMDGVKVTGPKVRTLSDGSMTKDSDSVSECSAPDSFNAQNASRLNNKTAFVADANEEMQPENKDVLLAGYTLSLRGTIAMNFYMELGDGVLKDDGAYMKFTLPGSNHTSEIVKLADVVSSPQERDGKLYYIFSAGVAAKDMTGEIKAQFIQSDGTKSEVYTTSIQKYCQKIRSNPDKYGESSVALAEAMMQYGGYAQIYFDYNMNDLANAGLNLPLPEPVLDDRYQAVSNGSSTGFKYLGTSLMLKTSTSIRHYFSGEPEDYEFTVDGEKLEAVTVNGKNYVEISNIRAMDLDQPMNLTVQNKADGSIYTLSYSVYSNIKKTVGNSKFSEKSQNMMRALYGYGEAAKAYFASKV